MRGICEEVEQVMSKVLGEEITGLFTLAQSVADKTGRNISSMLQDVRRRQPTEIDYITGYLLEQARQQGLPCPHNEIVYDAIKRM